MLREPTAEVQVIEWPAVSYERGLRDADLAVSVLDMLVNSNRWIHRRVETVAFGDVTVRRRIRLDVSIPATAPIVDGASSRRRLVPLTSMRKRSAIGLDLRDGAGRHVPYLSERQGGGVSETMFLTLAHSVAGRRFEAGVDDDLRAIASGRQEELVGALTRFVTDAGPLGRTRIALWRAPEFRLLFHRFANGRLVLALVDEEPTRQILELTYEEPLHLDGVVSAVRRRQHADLSAGARGALAVRAAASGLGLRPTDVRLGLPGAGDASRSARGSRRLPARSSETRSC